MSCQKDKNAGFELNDSDFPELSPKLTGRKEKGRRSAAAALFARKAENAGTFLVKTIDDPNHVLGKRRKERVLSESNDGFAPNVFYSIRRNDWDSFKLLNHKSELSNVVIEHVITSKDTNVVALHTIDSNDKICTGKASGKGTNLTSLLIGKGKKQRGRKARKAAQTAAEAESAGLALSLASADESSNDSPTLSTPKIHYNIYKPHKNQQVLAGKLFKKSYKTKKTGSQRNGSKKIVNFDDLTTSEIEQSIHIDEGLYKPSRDMKFCLGDFITDTSRPSKQTAPVFVRRQSIESNNDENANSPLLRGVAENLIDISDYLRRDVIFESTIIDTSTWSPCGLNQQVEEIQSIENVDVKWLDVDRKRLSIDATQKLEFNNEKTLEYVFPTLVIIVEKLLKRNELKITLNSEKVPTIGVFTSSSLENLISSAKNLKDIIMIITKTVNDWKINKKSIRNENSSERFSKVPENYHPSKNCKQLASEGKIITTDLIAKEMWKHGFEEDSEIKRSESFERIDLELCDDIDFSDEGSATNLARFDEKNHCKVQCALCHSSTDLFELEDCWECRDCLRSFVIQQLRLNRLPIQIPFVLNKQISSYQVLTAILPITILRCYTESMKTFYNDFSTNSSSPHVINCPSCQTPQSALINDPNTYRFSRCAKCSINFCARCNCEPHWPMNCQQFTEWSDKWDQHYKLHYLNTTNSLMHIKCTCGKDIEIRSDEGDGRVECDQCRRVFNPTTKKMLAQVYWETDVKTGQLMRRHQKSNEFEPILIETIPAIKVIRREIADACGQARKMRFNSSEFEKSVRKMKIDSMITKSLIDTRKTILFFTEFGLGLIYVTKKDQQSKQCLMSLMKLWIELEADIMNDSKINNIATRLAAVQSAFEKCKLFVEPIVN